MKQTKQVFQIATVFVGTIVGAGVSSGRELNQFFAVYGYKSVIGLLCCALSYIYVGKMIVEISKCYGIKSYSMFVKRVSHKYIGYFINSMLTLSLISSTSIILAGSSALIHQYFGIPRWMGFIFMIGTSTLFLVRKTEGLIEVNSFIVPCLVGIMTVIFVGFVSENPHMLHIDYLESIPRQKEGFVGSSIIYSSFNILSIIGIVVPLTFELEDHRVITKGVILGTIILTVVSIYIAFLMLVNPSYPHLYEIPILAVAKEVGEVVQLGLMCVIWLEMFSSQIANVYSISTSMEVEMGIPYRTGIFLVLLIAMPFSLIGFTNLVEFLYPIYGALSLLFVGSCVHFYYKNRIHAIFVRKDKQN